jgi:hypothetical protein
MEDWREKCYQVISKTIENFAFSFTSIPEENALLTQYTNLPIQVCCKYKGTKTGTCMVFAPTETADALFMSLFDTTPESEHLRHDILCEWLNIFTGHYLTEFFGTDSEFTMEGPFKLEAVPLISGEKLFEIHLDDFPMVVGVCDD